MVGLIPSSWSFSEESLFLHLKCSKGEKGHFILWKTLLHQIFFHSDTELKLQLLKLSVKNETPVCALEWITRQIGGEMGILECWVGDGEGRHRGLPEVPLCSSLPCGGKGVSGISHCFLRRVLGAWCMRVGAKVLEDILCLLLLLPSVPSRGCPAEKELQCKIPSHNGRGVQRPGLSYSMYWPHNFEVKSSCLVCILISAK